ncbi:hypothetical protein [Acetobacter sp. DsW_063]|uniref:hypothetical protein n=1 Tax=Acetobacter sp. DsW_063 TaxID=1514894 RepID=UPI000A391453|nr:hypothetical protein [Acetobacter sp. DsW_063]OUJ14705.1 hypothetical protein HK28_11805 [Acetobacter sp. DsW_063]
MQNSPTGRIESKHNEPLLLAPEQMGPFLALARIKNRIRVSDDAEVVFATLLRRPYVALVTQDGALVWRKDDWWRGICAKADAGSRLACAVVHAVAKDAAEKAVGLFRTPPGRTYVQRAGDASAPHLGAFGGRPQ